MNMYLAIVFFVSAVLVFVSAAVWMDGHDKEFNQSMQTYHECVIATYHMTPIEWYEENGRYPECYKPKK